MILKAILIFALLFLFMMMGAPMAIALGASTVITLVTTTSQIVGTQAVYHHHRDRVLQRP